MLESIFPVILKVLGCAVVIYVIAGLLVSLKWLLPILSFISAGGTCFAINFIQASGDHGLMWIPIALSVLTIFFYNGEGFMNPKINENLYRLVSIERKWKSVFADFDDYELHFSPVETGGFIENTIFSGIFFGIYYYLFLFSSFSGLVYIFPIFIAIMSVVEFLMIFKILGLTSFIYGCIRIIAFLISLIIGISLSFAPPIKPWRSNDTCTLCTSLAKFDYNTSYDMEFIIYNSNSSRPNGIVSQKHYLYDSTLKAGAYYTQKDWGTQYYSVYTKNPHFGDNIVQFNNRGDETGDDFRYIFRAPAPNGPFMYTTVHASSDFMRNYYFDKSRYDHSYQYQNSAGDENGYGTLCLEYKSRDQANYKPGDRMGYVVQWAFNTDKNKTPVSLKYIEFTYYLGTSAGYYEQWTYTPKHEGTDLVNLFDEENNLKDYTYNDSEICGRDMNEVVGSLKDYDCKISEKYSDVTNNYLYDSDTDMAAYYENRPDVAQNVDRDNISQYKPDNYISNSDYTLYDADGLYIDSVGQNEFEPFTFDNATTSYVIRNMMVSSFAFGVSNPTETSYGSTTYLTYSYYNNNLGTEVQYKMCFFTDNGDPYLHSLSASCTFDGREYNIDSNIMFDKYDIVVPTT